MSTSNDSTPAWWTNAVVYQIYPRSFADSNGDGIGDLGGIINRLDYLAELGVDVLWLSPIYASPQHDNGYDISDYEAIDPLFGREAQFDELLAGAHERGMKLIMDLVVNHSSSEHPWFLESRSSPDNPKRDWYWWRRPRDGFAAGEAGAEPTNWRSFFSGPVWTLDEAAGEYYLHLFAPEQPDLNWENPQLRSAVYAMMTKWLDRGVDGFRMDVINFISKRTPLRDGPQLPGSALGDGSAQFQCGPRIHEFLREMHAEVFAGRDAQLITVGEMPGVTIEHALMFTDPARAELDMVFQFEHVGLDHGPGGKWDYTGLDLPDLKASWARWQVGLAETGWNSLYLDNHDQPRLVSRFGDDGVYRYESATCWATLLHLHRGTPYIYQGEELGMTNVRFESVDDFRDIESRNYFDEAVNELGADPGHVLGALRIMSRDNARTPVQWDDSPNAGFSTGTPWIPVNPNYRHINAAADRAAERSIFRYYQRLIRLRHESEVVALGDFALLAPEHPALYAFTRSLGPERLLVLGNVSGEDLELAGVPGLADSRADTRAGGGPKDGDDGNVVIGNYGRPTSGTLLRPWEVRVLRG